MDSKASAPVLKHREWRFLLRDFVGLSPSFRRLHSQLLQICLSPAASVAWLLLKFAPEVLEEAKQRGSLQLLLPGVCTETTDEGRWFAFLPWLLGMPELKTHVYLVGDELFGTTTEGAKSSRGMARRQLEAHWRTPGGSAVEHLPAATIFNGLLSEWRIEGGSETRVDVCVLFAPGFSQHFDTWFTEADLLPYLRAGTPTAVFSYSGMDMMEDVEVLGLSGIESEQAEAVLTVMEQRQKMQARPHRQEQRLAIAVPDQLADSRAPHKIHGSCMRGWDQAEGAVARRSTRRLHLGIGGSGGGYPGPAELPFRRNGQHVRCGSVWAPGRRRASSTDASRDQGAGRGWGTHRSATCGRTSWRMRGGLSL